MNEIFNNREISIAIWMVIILVYVIVKSKDFLSSIRSVARDFFHPKIISVYLAGVFYTAIGVYLLYRVDLWSTMQIKDTILWCMITVFSTLLDLTKIREGKKYFKTALKENIKYTILVEFILNVYTFNLFIEILLVPLIIIMGFAHAMKDPKIKTPAVEKIANGFFTILGLATIGNAVYQIIANFSEFATYKTLDDFVLSPFLAIWFLPSLYMISLFATYEEYYSTTGFRIENKALLRKAKLKALLRFNVDTKGLNRWRKNIFQDSIKTEDDIDKSISEIKRLQKVEKAPPVIELKNGWSPYAAKNYLTLQGFETGYYSKYEDGNEWYAVSNYIKIGSELFTNNLSYYIYGNETTATKLELSLNVADPKNNKEALNKLVEHSKDLIKAAINNTLPSSIIEALLKKKNRTEDIGNYKLEVYFNMWDAKTKKFDIKFAIKHKNHKEFWDSFLSDTADS